MKFCPNCGSPRAARFCGNCGFDFETAEATVAIEVRITQPVWLPDQTNPSVERFWNGQKWTEMTKPIPSNVVWALSEADGLALAGQPASAPQINPNAYAVNAAPAVAAPAAASLPLTPLVYGEGFNPATNCHNCGNPSQKAGKECKLCGAVFNA